MKVDYNVTDEQLRAFGIGQHTIDVSRLPYMRPQSGNTWERQDIDMAYVNRINEAKDRVALAALAINNPDEKYVWYPPYLPRGEALIAMVRHDK